MPLIFYLQEKSHINLNPIQKIKNWEQWPFKLLYAPLTPFWIYYMIRSGAVWFFTPSNPKLTFGGLEGEPKKEMHDLLPEELCPVYFNVLPKSPFENILKNMADRNMQFPVIVKPEIGGQGILVRKINNEKQLKFYHDHVPIEYFVQQYVSFPLEVSLFYYRYPNEKKGHITGFLQKVPLQVAGDGVHTLRELILKNSKSKKHLEMLKARHGENYNLVLEKGEVYKLSDAANHNRGAQFIDLKNEINEPLVDMLDKISLRIDDFYYGRYDIMCNSIEELKQGKNFYILEYNGCGAEPNHFYDTGYTLKRAYGEILMHWKKLYDISRYNYKKGVKYWPFWKGLKFRITTRKYFKIARLADKRIP